MRIAIDHRLSVTPTPGVSQAVFHLLLTPPSGPAQTVNSWSVEMPGIGNAGRFTDGFGNTAHLVNQSKPEGEVQIRVRGEVTTRDTHGVLGRVGGEPVPALYRRTTALAKAPEALWTPFRAASESRIDVLHALMAKVGEALEPAEAPAAQTQGDGAQEQSQGAGEENTTLPPAADYAHLFIGAARGLDIPARFVIGYLLDDEDTASGLHAWTEAFDEGLGWIGFDPRFGICPTDRYVRLAVGLDAATAGPLRTVPAVEIAETATVSSADA